MSDLTPLICTQCGSKLKASEETMDTLFMAIDDDTFVFIGGGGSGDTFECEYCRHKFERKEKVKRGGGNTAVLKGDGAIAQGNGAVAAGAGSIVFGGSVSGSNIVMGHGNTVISQSDDEGTTVVVTQRRKSKR